MNPPAAPPARRSRNAPNERVQAIREFNRFYTRKIGVLGEGLLDSPFSLTEVRVLYELAHRDGTTAAELARELGLDPGYLSRLLRALQRRAMLEKRRSTDDARRSLLRLTRAGRAAFAPLEQRTRDEVAAMLRPLSDADQRALCAAMSAVRALLEPAAAERQSFMLRPHQPGDIGWVVHRQAVLYAQEYQWDQQFEALVARIGAQFIERFDPQCERCWIAERDGQIVGAVFVVRQSAQVAKLRMMYVEPNARGLGIGARLVDECIRFARQAGYRKMLLWTNSLLRSARRIYQAAGFELVESEPHHSFGHDLVGETWQLKFPPGSGRGSGRIDVSPAGPGRPVDQRE
jgi:DNA-binding MarR family transcriptional regulator/GNAT superfamily N-acetyltransferase